MRLDCAAFSQAMLLVRASAGPSKIHGIGLIAREFIPAGTKVWRFEPNFDLEITPERMSELSPAAQEQVMYYAYFHEPTRTFILSGDDDRVTNHSANPNTRCAVDYTYAVRDIHEGEEITGDYAEFVMLSFRPQ